MPFDARIKQGLSNLAQRLEQLETQSQEAESAETAQPISENTMKHQTYSTAVEEMMQYIKTLSQDPLRGKQARQFLAHYSLNTRFLYIGTKENPEAILLDMVTGLLWQVPNNPQPIAVLSIANQNTQSLLLGGLSGWVIPESRELNQFAKDSGNPLREDDFLAEKYFTPNRSHWLALHNNEICLKSYAQWTPLQSLDENGYLMACNRQFQIAGLLSWLLDQPLWLSFPENDFLFGIGYMNIDDYLDIDYQRCRLPKLEHNQFTDPQQGLWEFYQSTEASNVRGRNPALDVRKESVAIDFGTSSTVVAVQKGGSAELLRIGVQDFWQEAELGDYENPTVLEFLDLEATLKEWQSQAYQPNTHWNEVRCAHEAQADLRNNTTQPQKVAAILNKIKQWALREGLQDERVTITDLKHQQDHVLAHLTLRNPVKNQPLTVSNQDPFDPVELYAYFLGLYINWRKRGIYLNYMLTFPVAYPRESKEKILASFNRGLQRSFPQSLIDAQQEFAQYSVSEVACEPLAYAASAFHHHAIEPTDDGVGYAIFDFGGGTADFAYGIYRLPTIEEEEQGIEEVLEHLSTEGDRYLGGENLLENIVYQVFLHNIDVCRSQKVVFTRPLDAEQKPGLEMSVQSSREARTNTLVLMTQMRKFWENNQKIDGSILKITLINASGENVQCELDLPYDALSEYIYQRIKQGIQLFFIGMKKAFDKQSAKKVHILLAGNASRSSTVLNFFAPLLEKTAPAKETNDEAHDETPPVAEIHQILAEVFYDNSLDKELKNSKLNQSVLAKVCHGAPELQVHTPLPPQVQQPQIPSAKTGVALGLLKLRKGSAIRIINHLMNENEEAPFAYYVGAIQKYKFKVGLAAQEEYGTWKKVGIARENAFRLVYTTSPAAYTNEMPETDPELSYIEGIQLTGDWVSIDVFVRAKNPHTVELCTAKSLDEVNLGKFSNLQDITLK